MKNFKSKNTGVKIISWIISIIILFCNISYIANAQGTSTTPQPYDPLKSTMEGTDGKTQAERDAEAAAVKALADRKAAEDAAAAADAAATEARLAKDAAKSSTPAEQTPDFDPNKEPKKPSSEEFNVSTYLKLEQAQSYLDSKTSQEGAVGKFIVDIIILLTKIIGSFALLVIIAGGITIMISTGNQNLQTKGKEMIKYAIMGLIVAFMSLIIVTFVQSLFYTA